jgi:hypothetical protein
MLRLYFALCCDEDRLPDPGSLANHCCIFTIQGQNSSARRDSLLCS